MDKRSQKALLMFIKDFPNSNYIEEAQDVLSNIINDTTAWKYVYQRGTEEAYKEYLEDFPNGIYIEEALKQIKGYERIHKQEEQKKIEDHLKREEERRRIDPFYELMVPIKGGTFEMGDVFEEGEEREKPVHKVTLHDFMMCKYPVTQGLWKAVMGNDNNPSGFKGDDMLPVENVSWDMMQEFLEVLNKKSGASYRLPTEAEWEYAAREGGRKVRFGNGKDIADPAEMNFNALEKYKQPYSIAGTYREKTSPVTLFKPNALGLYDMSGNVWEWCVDYYADDYYQQCQKMGTVRNPKGPVTGSYRVLRGGSWFDYARLCRTTGRLNYTPASRTYSLGFRLVLSALPV